MSLNLVSFVVFLAFVFALVSFSRYGWTRAWPGETPATIAQSFAWAGNLILGWARDGWAWVASKIRKSGTS